MPIMLPLNIALVPNIYLSDLLGYAMLAAAVWLSRRK